jgi:hypothetical protein
MKIPTDIEAAEVAGKPLTYAWNLEVSRAIRHPLDTEHRRLANALSLLDEHACFALVLACAEWVAWRLSSIIDVDDALARIEAGYAALVDPRYAEIPLPKEPFPQVQRDAHGPLMLARILLSQALGYHAQGDRIVAAVTLSMALLARHVCPEPKAFDAWLSGALRRCHQFFPASASDVAKSPRIPPQFLDLTTTWDAGAATIAVQHFLASLDPAANPYLRSAQELRALGFAGTPYPRD